VLQASAEGRLRAQELKWRPGASVCVVMASGGYPGKYAAGKEIHGLEEAEAISGVSVFHAGTKREGSNYYTSSGRVLGVTGAGESLDSARRQAYDAVRRIQFADCHCRRDIALAGCRVANIGEA
jgi:phosphoribosylamine--glycine ligase